MANFIGLVYATLKAKGIDTSGMSTDEAVAKFNELQGTDKKSKEKESAKKGEAVSKFKGEKETPKTPKKGKYNPNNVSASMYKKVHKTFWGGVAQTPDDGLFYYYDKNGDVSKGSYASQYDAWRAGIESIKAKKPDSIKKITPYNEYSNGFNFNAEYDTDKGVSTGSGKVEIKGEDEPVIIEKSWKFPARLMEKYLDKDIDEEDWDYNKAEVTYELSDLGYTGDRVRLDDKNEVLYVDGYPIDLHQ